MITQQPHNPQNLTPEQVGVKDGWRLLLVGEQKPSDCQMASRCGRDWMAAVLDDPVNTVITYRTKQPSPFADGWIKMSERKPTQGRPAWLWDSKVNGARLFEDPCNFAGWHEDYTHWQPANIPAPPVVELTQAQKDEAAYQKFTHEVKCDQRHLWFTALAYARSGKGRA